MTVRGARTTRPSDEGSSEIGLPGRLFLWFPVGLAARRVSRYLRQSERSFATTSTGALTVDTPDGDPTPLLLGLTELLTEHEAADTRCVFKVGTEDLDVEDIHRVRTIEQVRQLYSSSWLIDMLRGERLTSVFQRIVRSDRPTQTLGHEALVRGISMDGRTMSPSRLFDAARVCGMVSELDVAAHRSAIRAVASHVERRQLFLNFASDALTDGVRSLAGTLSAIDDAGIPRDDVVLEVTDAERTTDIGKLRTTLDAVRHTGVHVALDDVGCGYAAARLIHETRPDYIKLDMSEVRRVTGGPSVRDAERLLSLAQRLKIETIAESVETDEELDWNRQFGATYVQGYLIGRPAALSA